MKYASLDEIMKGKQPGEVKVRYNTWDNDCWYRPFYKSESGYWYGLTQSGTSLQISVDTGNWTIYTPPKKLTTKWLWAYKTAVTGAYVTGGFFTKDEDAHTAYKGFSPVKTNVIITVEEGD